MVEPLTIEYKLLLYLRWYLPIVTIFQLQRLLGISMQFCFFFIPSHEN